MTNYLKKKISNFADAEGNKKVQTSLRPVYFCPLDMNRIFFPPCLNTTLGPISFPG
jgi:hypothetical protein